MASSTVALVIDHLTMQFGGLKAVTDFSLMVPVHSICGLIGPNGAGKTTVFNVLTGVYHPTCGSIHALGHSLVGQHPYQIVRLGLARTFQNIRLFKQMTVLDHLLIALDTHPQSRPYSFIASVLHTPAMGAEEADRCERATQLLEFFKLNKYHKTVAQNLPYGDQRRLEIARALATGAQILLLDEPAAGLNPQETLALMELIHEIRRRFGITVLLIEHDMRLVMGICERITVLDYGIKIAEGSAQEIQAHPEVIKAYLGQAHAG